MICNIQENFAHIDLPKILYNVEYLKKITFDLYKTNVDIRSKGGFISLRINKVDNTNNVKKMIRNIFTTYHNIDANFLDCDITNFLNSPNPLISCIILLNANDSFVKDLTIPSIIFNSKDTPIEIIVVNNGKTDIELDNNIKVIKSEFYHIPKAYNKAASMSKGKYLAFFHDDCFLSDEDWINKCIYNLTDEIIAVGPEYHEFQSNEDYKLRQDIDLIKEFQNDKGGFLKEVPLVMEKNNFFEIGGFPEREVLGQEDIFLHKNILKSGKKNLKVDINHYHFEGISTLLLFSNQNSLIKKLCNNFIFSKNETLALIKNGIGTEITQKIDYCLKLYKDNLYDKDISPFCDEIYSQSDSADLKYLPEHLKKESLKVQSFMDGTIKTFVAVKDVKCLDILNNFIDFNKLLFYYVVKKNEQRNY